MRPSTPSEKLDDAFADFLVVITCLKFGRGTGFRPAELAVRARLKRPLPAPAPAQEPALPQ
jgi:hypothetical protein